MRIKNLIGILCLLLFLSCGNRRVENIETLLQTWSGKEVLFPEKVVFTVQGKDTVNFSMSGKFKILTYVDSVGCISCKLQLDKWKIFMEEMNTNGADSVKYLFFFSPEKRRGFLGTLKAFGFVHPVCIDEKNRLNELNGFPPKDEAFHTFLLDKDNKVLAIGNPIHNPMVKELYLKIIRGEEVGGENKTKVVKTKLDIDHTSVSLGSFDWKEEQKTAFVIKNTGDKLLVIEGVSTSCGCTTVAYSKEPVQPGKEIVLEVSYKAEHPEHFNKTITVYCNAEISPLVLQINGDAK